MGELSGRRAVVTGGGKGIGLAIADALAGAGAAVTVLGRDEAALRASGHGFQVVDVTDDAALAGALGQPDILVNNAGAAVSAPLGRHTRGDWDAMLGVNLTPCFVAIQQVLPGMVTAGWGRIVNVGEHGGAEGVCLHGGLLRGQAWAGGADAGRGGGGGADRGDGECGVPGVYGDGDGGPGGCGNFGQDRAVGCRRTGGVGADQPAGAADHAGGGGGCGAVPVRRGCAGNDRAGFGGGGRRSDVSNERTLWPVVALCFAGILSEGYDVGVMGAILPALANDASWHLTPIQLGALGSWAIAGMFVGGIVFGTLGDLYGRRRMFVASLVVFSVCMAGLARSPSPFVFAVFRFVGGIGLGGIIPIAAALTVEYSSPGRRSANYGLMYSGYTLGILAAALVARAVLESSGWRWVVGAGVLPLLLVPVVLMWLPESLEYLVASGQDARAAALAARLGRPVPVRRAASVQPGWASTLAAMFTPERRVGTACFWAAAFMGLLLVYGLGTWLPQIMRRSGYELGPALLFLAVFALSSSIGGILMGEAADRRGVKGIVSLSFAAGAVAIGLLALKGPIWVTYALVAVAGYGTVSTSLILTGWLTSFYPAAIRTAAVGWTMSFARLGAVCGPLLVGVVQEMGAGPGWSFGLFALCGLVAAGATALVPQRRMALAVA